MSTPEDAYSKLAQILSNRRNDAFEIEILPLGYGSLLHDGNFIGITKQFLVRAFIDARRLFFDKLVHMNEQDFLRMILDSKVDGAGEEYGNSESANEYDSIATEIILLFDCEHLTACNWRKRRLNALIQHATSSVSNEKYRTLLTMLLKKERCLMTMYLCSPLHRHTKSPTLWQHRLWVLTQLIKVQLWLPEFLIHGLAHKDQSEKFSLLETAQNFTLDELHVVLRASEQHPRNYYAFSYMRQFHSTFCHFLEAEEYGFNEANADTSASKLAACMIDSTLTWCLAHPRDISGWTFLFYLLEAVLVDKTHRMVIGKVIQFALKVGWEGESLWTFVDLAIGRFGRDVIGFPFWSENAGSVDIPRAANHATLHEAGWKKWVARAKALQATINNSSDEVAALPRSDV